MGWGAFLATLTFLAWTDFALVANARWCGDADQHCLRDWVGALSGWAAAVAAGATLLFMRDQGRRQELVAWREIVNSAEFLRGELRPQVNMVSMALKSLENPNTAEWLGDSLGKIHDLLTDPEHHGIRTASVLLRAQFRFCTRLVVRLEEICKLAASNQRLINHQEYFDVRLTSDELDSLLQELERIVGNAMTPRKYMGF